MIHRSRWRNASMLFGLAIVAASIGGFNGGGDPAPPAAVTVSQPVAGDVPHVSVSDQGNLMQLHVSDIVKMDKATAFRSTAIPRGSTSAVSVSVPAVTRIAASTNSIRHDRATSMREPRGADTMNSAVYFTSFSKSGPRTMRSWRGRRVQSFTQFLADRYQRTRLRA